MTRTWRDAKVEFARSARRHRIGYAHAFHVIVNSEAQWLAEQQQFTWIGLDDRGVELEIVAVIKPDCLLVIHVMPTQLRKRES